MVHESSPYPRPSESESDSHAHGQQINSRSHVHNLCPGSEKIQVAGPIMGAGRAWAKVVASPDSEPQAKLQPGLGSICPTANGRIVTGPGRGWQPRPLSGFHDTQAMTRNNTGSDRLRAATVSSGPVRRSRQGLGHATEMPVPRLQPGRRRRLGLSHCGT